MRAWYSRSIQTSEFQSKKLCKKSKIKLQVMKLANREGIYLGGHLISSVLYDYKESQTNINLTKVSLVYLGGFFYVIPLPISDETLKHDFL